MKIGFDKDKYIELQSKNIRKRIEQFDNKLYLEFGGETLRNAVNKANSIGVARDVPFHSE